MALKRIRLDKPSFDYIIAALSAVENLIRKRKLKDATQNINHLQTLFDLYSLSSFRHDLEIIDDGVQAKDWVNALTLMRRLIGKIRDFIEVQK